MAKNTLAPPKANNLDAQLPPVGNYGPQSYGRPDSLYDRLEQLSYGLGGGLAKQVEGYGQMASHPLQSGQEMLAALQAVAQNPSLASNAMYGMWNRATSGLEGLGEVAGENLNPRNLLKNMAGAGVMGIRGKFPPIGAERLVTAPEKVWGGKAHTGEPIVGNVTANHTNIEVIAPARQAVAENKAATISLKNGAPINLVRMTDEYGDEGRIVALTPSGDIVGNLQYVIGSEGFHPNVFVTESFRRQGLATSMYDLAEATGGLIPSYKAKGAVRTPMGEAFRKNRAELKK